MRIAVLDTGVTAGAALRDEPWHEDALALHRDIADGRIDGFVATTFAFELRTALLKAVRRQRLAWEALDETLRWVERLGLVVATTTPPDREVIDACRRYGISWADCHPVLLARRLRAPLITSDERLICALRDTDIWVESIQDRPTDPEMA